MKSENTSQQAGAEKEKSFILPSVLDAESVEGIVKEISPWLGTPELCLTLNASGVDIIMSPGVQLLLSIDKTLCQTGGKLIVKQPSDFFVSIFQSLGLSTFLSQREKTHD